MQIRWTEGARQSLNQVEDYIAQDNPTAAVDTVLEIIKAVENLADHPEIGRIGRVFNTRELIINDTPYIVPYRVKSETIQILRVLHGAMQWPVFL